MSALYTNQTLTAQTAYAQLLDSALGVEHLRSVSDLNGSFNAKTVKGRRYWYFQYTEPSGKLRQVYVGPDSEAVRRLIARKTEPGVVESLGPLARAALALRCEGILPRHFRVMRRLADYGFFKAGGILIGTHSFIAFGNMLGVRWGQQERTQDIDFAHAGKSLALLLPGNLEVRTDDAITSLGMGFLPVSGLGGKTGATYLIPREPEFRLDFLTPLDRKGEPYEHPQLHVVLQPLPFMEFILAGVEQAVLFCPEGAVLVNVPDPARFALHKLLVYAQRTGTFRVKATKDLAQAAALLDYLWEHRRESVKDAARDLVDRGRGWSARLHQGVSALARLHPGLAATASLLRKTA